MRRGRIWFNIALLDSQGTIFKGFPLNSLFALFPLRLSSFSFPLLYSSFPLFQLVIAFIYFSLFLPLVSFVSFVVSSHVLAEFRMNIFFARVVDRKILLVVTILLFYSFFSFFFFIIPFVSIFLLLSFRFEIDTASTHAVWIESCSFYFFLFINLFFFFDLTFIRTR